MSRDVTAQYASEFVRANRVLRLPASGNKIVVGMVDPGDRELRARLSAYHGRRIRVVPISESQLVAGLSQLVGARYGSETATSKAARPGGGVSSGGATRETVDALSPAVPAVQFANALLYDGVRSRASDIHLEAGAGESRIRYRIDGVLHTVRRYTDADFRPVISRLKVMARVTATERRLPQDGRFSFHAEGHGYDVRTSFLPADRGESVALRLLETEADSRSPAELGMRAEQAEALAAVDESSGGLLVVSGPTGSGKTTTAHALLRRLADETRKIIAVEDPVEYRLPGVVQMQIRRDIGLDFDAALRRCLRHDPDVIMVGEIRDPETAALAVRAALSGQLVFSTVHTRDTASIDTRLENLGVAGYLLSEVVVGRLSQRLVRRVCLECAAERLPLPSERAASDRAGFELDGVIEGAGCPACRGTGFRGRKGLFDVHTRHHHDKGLEAEAWEAVRRGETTPTEVLRVLGGASEGRR